ncbi:hypothetical protein PCASD_09468 [Puccinia coronata f. sp. avenae]|uniref:Uncharacterized protein n=1 Tax=Puccinia coronata f. sp. avenae TaxID=200324 RepID=A0A2N5UK74_9BASI|nr:hypothetical protein PCASD_09468 [Puccinia coronata f. sp. avenae]
MKILSLQGLVALPGFIWCPVWDLIINPFRQATNPVAKFYDSVATESPKTTGATKHVTEAGLVKPVGCSFWVATDLTFAYGEPPILPASQTYIIYTVSLKPASFSLPVAMSLQTFDPRASTVNKADLLDFLYENDRDIRIPSSSNKEQLIALVVQQLQAARLRRVPATGRGMRHRSNPPDDPPATAGTASTTRRRSVPGNVHAVAPVPGRPSHRSTTAGRTPARDVPDNNGNVSTTRRRSVPGNVPAVAPVPDRPSHRSTTAAGTPARDVPDNNGTVSTTRVRSVPGNVPVVAPVPVRQSRRSTAAAGAPARDVTNTSGPIEPPVSVPSEEMPAVSHLPEGGSITRAPSPTFAEVVQGRKKLPGGFATMSVNTSKVKEAPLASVNTPAKVTHVKGKESKKLAAPQTGSSKSDSDVEVDHAVVGPAPSTSEVRLDAKGKKTKSLKPGACKNLSAEVVQLASTSAQGAKGKKKSQRAVTPMSDDQESSVMNFVCKTVHFKEGNAQGKEGCMISCTPAQAVRNVNKVISTGSSIPPTQKLKGKRRATEDSSDEEIKNIAAKPLREFLNIKPPHFAKPGPSTHAAQQSKGKRQATDDSSDEEIKKIAARPLEEPLNITPPHSAEPGPSIYPTPKLKTRRQPPAAEASNDFAAMPLGGFPNIAPLHFAKPELSKVKRRATNINNGPVDPPRGGTLDPPRNGAVDPPRNGAVDPSRNGAAPPTRNGAAPPPRGGAADHPPRNGAAPPPRNGAIDPPRNGPRTISFTIHPSITCFSTDLSMAITRMNVGRTFTPFHPVDPNFQPTISRIQVGNEWRYIQHGQYGRVGVADIPTSPEWAVKARSPYYWDPKHDTRHPVVQADLLDSSSIQIPGLPEPLAADPHPNSLVPNLLLDYNEALTQWSLIDGSEASTECNLPNPLAPTELSCNPIATNPEREVPGAFPSDSPNSSNMELDYPPAAKPSLESATATKDPFAEFVQEALTKLRQLPKSIKPTFLDRPSEPGHSSLPCFKPRAAENRFLSSSSHSVPHSPHLTMPAPIVTNQSPPSDRERDPYGTTSGQPSSAEFPSNSHQAPSTQLQVPQSPAVSDYYDLADPSSDEESEPAALDQEAGSTSATHEAQLTMSAEHIVTFSYDAEPTTPTDAAGLMVTPGNEANSTPELEPAIPVQEAGPTSPTHEAQLTMSVEHVVTFSDEAEPAIPTNGDELMVTPGDEANSTPELEPAIPVQEAGPTSPTHEAQLTMSAEHIVTFSYDAEPTTPTDVAGLMVTPGNEANSTPELEPAVPVQEAGPTSPTHEAQLTMSVEHVVTFSDEAEPTTPTDVAGLMVTPGNEANSTPELEPAVPVQEAGPTSPTHEAQLTMSVEHVVTFSDEAEPTTPTDVAGLMVTPGNEANSTPELEPAVPVQEAGPTSPTHEAQLTMSVEHVVTFSDEAEPAIPTNGDELMVTPGDEANSTRELEPAVPVQEAGPTSPTHEAQLTMPTEHIVTFSYDAEPTTPTDAAGLMVTPGNEANSTHELEPAVPVQEAGPTSPTHEAQLTMSAEHIVTSSDQAEPAIPTDGDEFMVTPGNEANSIPDLKPTVPELAVPVQEVISTSAIHDAFEAELTVPPSKEVKSAVPHATGDNDFDLPKALPRLELIPNDDDPSIFFNPAIDLSLQDALQDALAEN